MNPTDRAQGVPGANGDGPPDAEFELSGKRDARRGWDEEQGMAVELTPPSAYRRGESGSYRAENGGDRLRERHTERSNRCDARTRLWATDQNRDGRRRKPTDGHRRAEPLPCARGSGDHG